MFEAVWTKLFGEMSVSAVTALFGFITGALSFTWDKVSQIMERRRKAREEILEKSMEDAVLLTDKEEPASNLEKEQNVPQPIGAQLLSKAIDAAITIAKARGVDAEKVGGGKKGLEAATQGKFKAIKRAMRSKSDS